MFVRAKKRVSELAQVFGDAYGCTVLVDIPNAQRWRARKSGSYWILTRKGSSLKLRLTNTAFNKLFEDDEEVKA